MKYTDIDVAGLRSEFARIKPLIIICMPLSCQNCGSSEFLEIHHIVPIVFGGSNKITNLATLCGICHRHAHGDGKGTSVSARTALGREAAKARGVKFGPKMKFTPEQLAAAAEFARQPGQSVTAAALKFGCSRATLYNYMQREAAKCANKTFNA